MTNAATRGADQRFNSEATMSESPDGRRVSREFGGLEELRARKRRCPAGQPLQSGGAQVRKRTNEATSLVVREAREQRHVLARVVRAGRRRITAVVGGDDEQVVLGIE